MLPKPAREGPRAVQGDEVHLLGLVGPDEEPPAEQGYHGVDDSQPVTLVATGPAARVGNARPARTTGHSVAQLGEADGVVPGGVLRRVPTAMCDARSQSRCRVATPATHCSRRPPTRLPGGALP